MLLLSSVGEYNGSVCISRGASVYVWFAFGGFVSFGISVFVVFGCDTSVCVDLVGLIISWLLSLGGFGLT